MFPKYQDVSISVQKSPLHLFLFLESFSRFLAKSNEDQYEIKEEKICITLCFSYNKNISLLFKNMKEDIICKYFLFSISDYSFIHFHFVKKKGNMLSDNILVKIKTIFLFNVFVISCWYFIHYYY